jgi:hypothetical protein
MAREILGDVMGGAEGCDGPSLRVKLEIWDENFLKETGTYGVSGAEKYNDILRSASP